MNLGTKLSSVLLASTLLGAPFAASAQAQPASARTVGPTVTLDMPVAAYVDTPFDLSVTVSGPGPYTYRWHPGDRCTLTTDATAAQVTAKCAWNYDVYSEYLFRVDVFSNGHKVGTASRRVDVGGPHIFLDPDRLRPQVTVDHDTSTWTPVVDGLVTLQVKWYGTNGWRRYGVARTDDHGTARFPWTIDRAGRIRAVFAGDATTPAMRSEVRAFTLPVRIRYHRHGLTVHARVFDGLTGKPVAGYGFALDRNQGYYTHIADRGRTDAQGRITLHGDQPGTWHLAPDGKSKTYDTSFYKTFTVS